VREGSSQKEKRKEEKKNGMPIELKIKGKKIIKMKDQDSRKKPRLQRKKERKQN